MGSKDRFIVIARWGDGDVRVREMGRHELLEYMNDEEKRVYLGSTPTEADPQYWGDGEFAIIIKGEIVQPKPVTTITRLEVD